MAELLKLVSEGVKDTNDNFVDLGNLTLILVQPFSRVGDLDSYKKSAEEHALKTAERNGLDYALVLIGQSGSKNHSHDQQSGGSGFTTIPYGKIWEHGAVNDAIINYYKK